MEKSDKKLFFERANFLILPFCLLPVLGGFLFVYFFGVNAAFWDQLDVIPLFNKLFSGTLTFHDLFINHNEHRIFFPRIIMLALGVMTRYNCKVEMYCVILLIVTVFLFIFFKVKEQYHFTPKTVPWWFIILPFLLFTPTQHENMTWGFQISFVMPLTFGIIAFYFMEKVFICQKLKNLYFIVSLSAATIASFSSSMGLMVWVVCLLQMLILNHHLKNNNKNVYFFLWILIGLLSFIFYNLNFEKKPDYWAMLLKAINDPANFLLFFLRAMGNFFPRLALFNGIIIFFLICLTIYLLHNKKKLLENTFWFALILFSFLTLITVSLGRFPMGMGWALKSRYVTYSIPIPLALTVLLVSNYRYIKFKILKNILLISMIFLILEISWNIRDGILLGIEDKAKGLKYEYVLSHYNTLPDDELLYVYPCAWIVRERAAILESLKYNVFAGK